MISLAEAEALIAQSITPLQARTEALDASLGLTLAANPLAKLTQPQWPQVAMDGYAINLQNNAAGPWPLPQQLAATGEATRTLLEGHAVQVTTGAPLPTGADTVVIQENTTRINDEIHLTEPARQGANIRPRGQDFEHGDAVGRVGQVISPGAIAALQHAGIKELRVVPRPRLGIVITGSELIRSSQSPADGQTPDTNGPFLRSWAQQHQLHCDLRHCNEDPSALQALVTTLSEHSDLIIVCGGASVGPRDGSHAGLIAAGARRVFSKVAQKPGKPMALYLLGDKPVLLLPGNPAAVFCGSHWHLQQVVHRLQGGNAVPKTRFHINGALPRVGGRTLLLRAHAHIDAQGQLQATVLDGQLSHLLGNLMRCNAILQLDPGSDTRNDEYLQGILLSAPGSTPSA